MATGRRIVSSSADVAAALATEVDDDAALEAVVGAAVPVWLAPAVEEAHRAGRAFVVSLSPQPSLAPDEAAGWEVGVLTTVLALGVDEVHGADPVRLRRVHAVLERLEAS